MTTHRAKNQRAEEDLTSPTGRAWRWAVLILTFVGLTVVPAQPAAAAVPVNDDFAEATPVTTFPYDDTVDHLITATTETGEPLPCAGGAVGGTVWWAFTPTATGSYMASLSGPLSVSLAVYTGSALNDLDIISCASGDRVSFLASADTTYYVRAQAHVTDFDTPMYFRLDTTPDPVAEFAFLPSDPSVFDDIQFADLSFDPAGVGFQSVWDFGDHATATGCCPTHRYARDRDYTIRLTVTTNDGRTASISHVVQVSTHDVATVRIDVPKSARVGQRIEVNVYVKNYRQPETVQVDLFKSSPFGFLTADSHTQAVPVKGATKFRFTNTITEADGILGKVSFKALAMINGHRDVLPADNEFISVPITVRPR
jgi:PKD repeat protein